MTGAGESFDHTWRFNPLDRLYEAVLPGGADPTLSLAYRDNDDLDLLTHGNGATTDYDYWPHGPIQSITVSDATPTQLHRLSYTVDALLDIDTISEEIGTAPQTPDYDFDYDAAERLTGHTLNRLGLDTHRAPTRSFQDLHPLPCSQASLAQQTPSPLMAALEGEG